jgi:hypothetical protein
MRRVHGLFAFSLLSVLSWERESSQAGRFFKGREAQGGERLRVRQAEGCGTQPAATRLPAVPAATATLTRTTHPHSSTAHPFLPLSPLPAPTPRSLPLQWKMLLRRHAALVAADARLAPRFERECYSYLPPRLPRPPYVAAQNRSWVHRTCVSGGCLSLPFFPVLFWDYQAGRLGGVSAPVCAAVGSWPLGCLARLNIWLVFEGGRGEEYPGAHLGRSFPK